MSYLKYILALAVTVFFSGTPAYALKTKGPPPASVVVSPARMEAIQNRLDLIGSIISPRESAVSSEGEGLISKVFVLEGDRVIEGSPLIKMVNSRIAILMEEAVSTVKEAENRLSELRSQLEKLENDYDLNRKLFIKKIINTQVLTNSRLKVEAATEGIAQAEFNIITKKTKIALYKDQIKKLVIVAPFSGVVTRKLVARGEWLKQGQQVVKIMDTDPLWIEVNVPENKISRIRAGTSAIVNIQAYTGKTFSAGIFKIIPKADTVSRTFPVRLRIKNSDGALKSGMTANVSLPYGKKKRALMIPRDAITIKGGRKIVFALGENSSVKMFSVETGITLKGWTEITGGGLSSKDLVVTRGGERLRPGQKVSVIKQ